jgi:hypothetical protein
VSCNVLLAVHAAALPAIAPSAEDGAEAASGAGGGAAAPPGSLQQRTLSTVVLPACDSKALCAFVDLFRWVGGGG